jgi:hypothetical protein
MAPKTLKASNRWRLAAAIGFNIALFLGLLSSHAWSEVSTATAAAAARSLLTGGVGLILVTVLNALFSPSMKARLVYWRWNDPLPGGRAFSVHGPADPRVDMAVLKRLHGPLPSSCRDQNATWYRWFKSAEKEPSIEAAHRDFLFLRDLAGLSFLAAFLLGSVALLRLHGSALWGYLAFLVAQYLIVATGARNNGIRMVTSVLAWKALAPPENAGRASA